MGTNRGGSSADRIASMVEAARVFAGITAESIAQADTSLSLPQLRVLVLASRNEPLSATAVATALEIHPSNASRLCDRLVRAGMLDRRDRPDNRRQIELTLTPEGRRQLELIDGHRRRVFAKILRRLAPEDQGALQSALRLLVVAADGYEASRTSIP